MSDERRTQSRRPDDWLFDTLNRMEETEARHHKENALRLDAAIRRMDEHEERQRKRLDEHSERLIVIETERKREKDEAVTRAGFQSLGIGTLLIAFWEVIKRKVLNWP